MEKPIQGSHSGLSVLLLITTLLLLTTPESNLASLETTSTHELLFPLSIVAGSKAAHSQHMLVMPMSLPCPAATPDCTETHPIGSGITAGDCGFPCGRRPRCHRLVDGATCTPWGADVGMSYPEL